MLRYIGEIWRDAIYLHDIGGGRAFKQDFFWHKTKRQCDNKNLIVNEVTAMTGWAGGVSLGRAKVGTAVTRYSWE